MIFVARATEMLVSSDDATLTTHWRTLVADIKDAPQPPYHLALAADELDRLRGTRPRSQLRILDHGCGPASALIWLAAIGFTNLRGVDVGGELLAQNRWARVALLGHDEDRFAIYDDITLPVPAPHHRRHD